LAEIYRAVLLVHVALGCAALIAFWAALVQSKGSSAHRRFGKIFVWTMRLTALSALLLCLAVYAFEVDRVRPPTPGLGAEELAAYAGFIRTLFGLLAASALLVLVALGRAMHAMRRGRIAAHVGWILSASAVAHTALFVSILPRIAPGIYGTDPLEKGVRVVQETEEHPRLWSELLRGAGSGGDPTSVAWIAAIALEHGASVLALDSDFARFAGVRWESPR
jgi:uncharacterized membrane protein